jgi:HEAT repeats
VDRVYHHLLLLALLIGVGLALGSCNSGPTPDEPQNPNGESPAGENPGEGEPESGGNGQAADMSTLENSGFGMEFMDDVFIFFGADRPPSRALTDIRDVHDLGDWSYLPQYPNGAQQTRDAIEDLRESDYTSWEDTALVVAILSTMVSRDRSALVRDDCITTIGWFRSWVHPRLMDVGPGVSTTEEEVLQALKVLDALHKDLSKPLSQSDKMVCIDAISVLGSHSWDKVESGDPIVHRTKMSRPRGVIRRLTGRDLKVSATDPEIRDTLDRALIRVTDQTLFLTLVAGLADPIPYVRATSAQQLRHAGDPRALKPLLFTLGKDENAPVRLALIGAIAEVAVLNDDGKAQAVSPLAAALTDPSTSVQRAAARALARVTGENPGPDPIDWRRWWMKKTGTDKGVENP